MRSDDATHEDAALVCDRLADALADHFALLGRGLTDRAVDDAVRPLLGLQLNALGGEVTATVLERIDALRQAIASSTTSTSVRVAATQQVSAPGVPGYAPALGGQARDGLWAAWLSFEPRSGDEVTVRRLDAAIEQPWPATPDDPDHLDDPDAPATTGRRVVVRPTLASGPGAEGAWLLYSTPNHAPAAGSGWQLWARRIGADGIGAAELVTHGVDHALNQEACLDGSGRLHMVCQQLDGGRFRIAYRCRDADGWSDAELVSPAGENAWDPCLVVHDDRVTLFWSTYRRHRFRIVGRARAGGGPHGRGWDAELEVPTGADRHALHPQAAADRDGLVWLTYDSVAVPDQASSGLTRFRAAADVGTGGTHDPVPDFDLTCHVEVVAVTGRTFGTPVTTQPIAERAAACYPRVAVDGDGRLWLAHRTMRQLPFGDYLAHVAVRVHDGDDWSPPRLLPTSDGTCAELSLSPGEHGVTVLYHSDDHARRHLAMLRGHAQPSQYLSSEEALRREHLRLPSTQRMAAGGHVGEGVVTATAVRADSPARRPRLSTVAPDPAATTTGTDPGPDTGTGTDPRDHTPVGRPPGGPTQHLYWGDLHRHSNVSRCGAGLDIAAEDHYRFADDLLGCDFWALTDHAENTSDLNWHHLKKLANAFYRPGSHASLIGFEWTSFVHGHLNVIYAGDDGPIVSSVEATADDPEKLWQRLDGHEALTIPHHPASWVYPTNWSYRSERFLRLVEVFQACTGSYESHWCHRQYHDAVGTGSSVQDALRAGHRLGFIGSTDHGNGAAYVGLYADRLDRAAVMQALTERRCFAATRRGIVPELRIGEAGMGQEVSLGAGAAPSITYGGEGIAELAVVQLVRDGVVVASSNDQAVGGVDVLAGEAATPVLLRLDVQVVVHEGGPRDLTGIVRVDGPARLVATQWYPPEVTSVDAEVMTWSTTLPQRYGKRLLPPGVVTLGVTVSGHPQALVSVEAGDARLQASLADLCNLTDGRTRTVEAAGCDVRARVGIGGLTGLGTRRWTAQAPEGLVRAGSWYYVRVIQVDGEIAWSSPVWVDA